MRANRSKKDGSMGAGSLRGLSGVRTCELPGLSHAASCNRTAISIIRANPRRRSIAEEILGPISIDRQVGAPRNCTHARLIVALDRCTRSRARTKRQTVLLSVAWDVGFPNRALRQN